MAGVDRDLGAHSRAQRRQICQWPRSGHASGSAERPLPSCRWCSAPAAARIPTEPPPADAGNGAVPLPSRVSIDCDRRRLAGAHIIQLGFLRLAPRPKRGLRRRGKIRWSRPADTFRAASEGTLVTMPFIGRTDNSVDAAAAPASSRCATAWRYCGCCSTAMSGSPFKLATIDTDCAFNEASFCCEVARLSCAWSKAVCGDTCLRARICCVGAGAGRRRSGLLPA